MSVPTMLTIKETARRAGVAQHFVRQLCLSHKIVFRKSGSKYLVNFDKFIEYLDCSEKSDPADTDGNIRALT